MLVCRKCNTVCTEDNKALDGYYTCGRGGSHVVIEVSERPAGRARVSSSNHRKPPRLSPKRQVIRRQLAETAREMGRDERTARAVASLDSFTSARRANARDSRERPNRS